MPTFTSITGGGAFTRADAAAINANFSAVNAPDLWVRPQAGNNTTANGTYERPFASVTGACGSNLLKPGMTIGLLGVTFEEFSSPIVNDITIVGMGNQPRQATTSGAANGGGSTWLSPTSGASTHLAIVRGQGWKFQNIYFNNSTASKAAIQILISGGGDPPADPSAEHTQVIGCYLTGAKYGVLSTGGANFCTLKDNVFFGFGDSGDTAIISETGAGVHSLYGWVIKNNSFNGNDVHIDIASSGAEVAYNHFTYIDNGVTTSIQIDMTGGANNSVHDNMFDLPYSSVQSTMFVQGTNDRWGFNRFTTAVDTTTFSFGDPTST